VWQTINGGLQPRRHFHDKYFRRISIKSLDQLLKYRSTVAISLWTHVRAWVDDVYSRWQIPPDWQMDANRTTTGTGFPYNWTGNCVERCQLVADDGWWQQQQPGEFPASKMMYSCYNVAVCFLMLMSVRLLTHRVDAHSIQHSGTDVFIVPICFQIKFVDLKLNFTFWNQFGKGPPSDSSSDDVDKIIGGQLVRIGEHKYMVTLIFRPKYNSISFTFVF
jgi:hypothetical protein